MLADIGDKVFVKTDPERVGVITQVLPDPKSRFGLLATVMMADTQKPEEISLVLLQDINT